MFYLAGDFSKFNMPSIFVQILLLEIVGDLSGTNP